MDFFLLRIRSTYLSQISTRLFVLIFLISTYIPTPYLFGEGTKQLQPTSSDNGFIQIFDNNTTTRPFATYNCPEANRLNIRICNSGEKIYMGFRQTDNDVYFQLKDPNGVVVMGPSKIPNAAGPGYIASYAEAVAGPRAIVGATGYNALTYTSTMAGDYYIEFNPSASQTLNPVKRVFTYFDISVATAANVIKLGRLWSKSWDFQCNSATNQFKAKLYIYADDGIVTSLDFNGMQPFGFVIAANNAGCTNTGTFATDRQSVSGNINYPQYKVFLNDPDINCFPTGVYGTVNSVSLSGCVGSNFCIDINVDKPGKTEILFELNGTAGYQANTTDRLITADLVAGNNCVTWDGKDGKGNIVTGGVNITTKVDYYNGLTHLPLFDVENNTKGYIVDLVRPTGPRPSLFWDDSKIGGGTNLTGCNSATGCHTWSGDFGDAKTINTWWYVNSTTKTVTNFVPPSVITDANADKPGTGSSNDSTLCSTITSFKLNGKVTNAGGGIWSSSGSGTFTPSNTSLQGTYTPSAADIANGSVKLILSSTGNGVCSPKKDSITYTFAKQPAISAGPDKSACANNPKLSLSATMSGATGLTWSGGAGTYTPNKTSANITYTPTAAEISAGSVVLNLATTGNGVCTIGSGSIKLTYTPIPTADAGVDQSICKNNNKVNLNGAVNYASGGTWTGGAGSFNPDANTLNATYTPTAAELTAGSVNLTLTTTGMGSCLAVNDAVAIKFTPIPVVNAGNNQSICKNNTAIPLNGSVTGATTTGTWSGGTGTYSPNANTLNATYIPTTAEVNTGNITLTLTSTNNGNCTAVTSNTSITFTAIPVVSVGSNIIICENNPVTVLNGSVTGATGGNWITGGGTYSPGRTALTTTYTASASEVAAGFFTLTLESTGNGNCNPVSKTLNVLVDPKPTVNAGTDDTLCTNNPAIKLSGSVKDATSYAWSGGAGIFTPDNSTLNATYTPTASEISSGIVTLTLTATKPSCNSVSDQVVYRFSPTPTVNAGTDQSKCKNNGATSLNGTVTISKGGIWSGGAGTFAPDNISLNATYTPTASEITTGAVTLTLTTTGNGKCLAVKDDILINFTNPPTITATNSGPVCGNNALVKLNAVISSPATGVLWAGNGAFTPSASDINANYTPTASEISAGQAVVNISTTGNGNCLAVTGQTTISITPAPTANAGADKDVCADNPSVVLSGNVTIATGGTWTGGKGTYAPNSTTLNATYTPSTDEITSGSVTLTLTTSGNGNCVAVSDQVLITIKPSPITDAGSDQTVCGDASTIPLNGSIQNATGGKWTTNGTGTFSPNDNVLNASYNPSAADKAKGGVTLTLTSQGNGLCSAVKDNMKIDFTVAPSINAGPDQIVCPNDFPVKLNAFGSNAAWSGGSGSFNPSVNSLSANYIPSASEIASGSVTLTITTIVNGVCKAVSDDIKITIPPAPVVDAGTDLDMCGNAITIGLNGTINNASGAFWTSSGTGSFLPDAFSKSTTYKPSATDKTSGKVKLTLTSTGNGACTAISDSMIITIHPAVTVSAGPDQTVCADASGITLNGSSNTLTGLTWSNGSGSFSPNATTLNATYVPTSTERTNGTVKLILTTSPTTYCPAQKDTVVFTITPAPTVDAGTDISICGDSSFVKLNGSINTIPTGAIWTSTGSGTFSLSATDLNASYVLSNNDKTAGTITLTLTTTGNGTCNPVSSQIKLNIAKVPVVDAGPDQTLCADVSSIALNATVTNASGGTWKTTGNGTFNPNANIVNASYIPSSADLTNGIVSLTLTSTGNGLCKSVSDITVITFTPAPKVNAGSDLNICANNTKVSLNGDVTIATGGTWSGGAGTFTPSNNQLTVTYVPSASEISSGTVTLKLTSTGNGICKPVEDDIIITILPAPVVNAGNDIAICADSFAIKLNGQVLNAPGGQWISSGTGSFLPDNTTLGANYVPSAADRASGNITLKLTSSAISNCITVSDDLNLIISPAPTVNAGTDKIVCANNAIVNLSATTTVTSDGQWTSSGTGTFTNPNSLVTDYIPSALDINAGNVNLTLTTLNNGLCKPVKDQLNVQITPAPTSDAGLDQTVCSDTSGVRLNGKITIATGALWTTSGDGTFSPNATTLNAIYKPSVNDMIAKSVILTLTTTGNGLCIPVSDSVKINITPKPIVDAGTDLTICSDASGVSLNGSILNATGSRWRTLGTGSFSPNSTTLNATYVPNSVDKSTGKVTLTLSSTGSGVCATVRDTLQILITPAPTINAGPSQTLCADFEGAALNGTTTVATGGTWISSGSGTFSDANSLVTTYYASSSDLASGSVLLTLTSTGNGTCKAVSSKLTLTINPIPTVEAGSDKTYCGDISNIPLNGSYTKATGGYWSTNGSGIFTPDEFTANATYTPSVSEKTSGQSILTFTTTGNGACNFVSDNVTYTFTPVPTSDAGPDQTVCADITSVNLSGNVTIASGGIWKSSGSGTFSPSINDLNAKYTPSASDKSNGSVTLTLTTAGNGTCSAVSNDMIITITPAPIVNAGLDQTVCADVTGVVLDGTFSVASGIKWTTSSGTGTFIPDDTTPNATFIPSSLQIGNGKATITLTTTGNGTCNAVKDAVIISLSPVPQANAGNDVTVCAGVIDIPLNGTVVNASGGTWTSSGTGTFLPDENALNASYVPSASENVNGQTVTITLTTTGNGSCSPVADQITISFNTVPVFAGPPQSICTNGFPVKLNGSGNGSWTSPTGGSFSPNPNSLNASYSPTAADIAAGYADIILTGSSVGTCLPGKDTVRISISQGPVVNAGSDLLICENNSVVSLSASVSQAADIKWSTSGAGSFSSATGLTTIYTPTSQELSDGNVTLIAETTGNGICAADTDQVVITFTPAPTAKAGSDEDLCADISSIDLNGSITIAAGSAWSSDGNGSIASAASLTTTYTPTPADKSKGFIIFTLTTSGSGNCTEVTDQKIVRFTAGPIAYPGTDTSLCADISELPLKGSVSGATGGIWSTNGTGTFSPNANTLNASYIPSVDDLSKTSITLTLLTTGTGICTPTSNNRIVSFTTIPTVNPGTGDSYCSDVLSIPVNALVTVASGVSWKTSTGGSFGDENLQATDYFPTNAEKASGKVTLNVITTGNGKCKAVAANVDYFFTPAPTVEAGFDIIRCSDATTIDLEGNVTIATGGVWTTSGNGTFSNDSNLQTIYQPSVTDKSNGSVILTLSTTGMGKCLAVTDALKIDFTPVPVVSVGSDQNVCADTAGVSLSSTYSVAGGINWKTSGSGTFLTSFAEPNVKYIPSQSDTASGSVQIIATTIDNGDCQSVSDTMYITINKQPVINAGIDRTMCTDEKTITLGGYFSNTGGILWTSTGTGVFSDPTLTSPVYTPSIADKINGGVIFTATTTGTGLCKIYTDISSLSIYSAPVATVNAGLDQSLCKDIMTVKLTGFIANAGGGIWSSTNGGTFSDVKDLEGTFYPVAAEKAAGKADIVLTTTNNGFCNAQSDTMTITFTAPPTVTAGADTTICGDLYAIKLPGNFTVSSGIEWKTGGSGTFVPDATTPNASYIPSKSDITAGKVGLTITTTGNGTCNAVSASKKIQILPIPTANAGQDQTVCADLTKIAIKGNVSGATGGTWKTTGTGTFSPNANSLNASYIPSPEDIQSSAVNLILTTTGTGICNQVTSKITITITPKPIINAGPDILTCANVPSVQLNGNVTVAGGMIWITSGSGIFMPSAASLNPSYTPSEADQTAGKVILTAYSTNNGKCNIVNDSIEVTINKAPIVTATSGNPCVYKDGVALSGTVVNASGIEWKTSGTGTFSLSSYDLNPSYFPSENDIAANGTVIITAYSTGNGVCNAESANTSLLVSPLPIADAGSDQYVCTSSNATLNAFTYPGNSYSWKSLSGITYGNDATITISAPANQTVVLTVTDSKKCPNYDTVSVFTITPPSWNLISENCYNDTLVLRSNPYNLPSVPGSFAWYKDGVILQNKNQDFLATRDPGQYTVQYYYGNCKTEASATINALPEFNIPAERLLCNQSTGTLVANINTIPNPPEVYSWTTGSNFVGNTNPVDFNVLPDSNFYKLKITDVKCSAEDSVRIIGIDSPITGNLKDVASCEGQTVVLVGTPTNFSDLAKYNPIYQWTPSSLGTNDTVEVKTTGTYGVTVTLGECAASYQVNVQMNKLPEPFMPERQIYCFDNNKYMMLDAGPGERFKWENSSDTLRQKAIIEPGIYIVTVTNSFNCSLTDSTEIVQVCAPTVYIPNAIEPEGEISRNQDLHIFGKYFTNFKMTIYNRWGEIIFYTEDRNKTWDGTYLGKLMPEGSYNYIVTYEGLEGEYIGPYKKEGKITLMR
ncbi:MAG: gliding motility-associated C-terminal domain-containing protein [Sporocytophaga sp.]|uniref:T9SS type B sorting domain-containing protein n=1 Tax=Sporocytophaga sp. TaxID=2231183 RepID=UPI001B2D74E5|nr:gliding motility-associated C-terminal domain-containing protein [Sporocytophaga sp.]MBO9700559.1 gliding motility-associated C-terminal domain-containing protein [Sporocytophaga sp.]